MSPRSTYLLPGLAAFAAGLVVYLQLSSVSLAQGKSSPKLVATPYPGSVLETHPGIESPNARRFYSRDDVDKIEAYYAKTFGPFQDHWLAVIPDREVYNFLEKNGIHLGEAGGAGAGITVQGKPTGGRYPVIQALDKLTKAYLARFINDENPDPAAHINDPELTAAIARYKPLELMYYMEGEMKDSVTGRYLTMETILYDEHFLAPERAMLKEQNDLLQKMTSASTSMNFDEATKIGEKLSAITMRQTDTSWEWDVAIKCLDEMKANAYASIIVIELQLSEWDLSVFNR